eukprot:scaffold40318_cov350-Skeletonema_marinoi.AAC.1
MKNSRYQSPTSAIILPCTKKVSLQTNLTTSCCTIHKLFSISHDTSSGRCPTPISSIQGAL